MDELFANKGDPDQKLHSAASDLGLHCLPITLLRVSRLQWVNQSAASMYTSLLLKWSPKRSGFALFANYPFKGLQTTMG